MTERSVTASPSNGPQTEPPDPPIQWWRPEKVGALAAVVQTILLGIALYFTAVTLREGNRISWRTSLDAQSADMGRKLIETEALRCVYRYRVPAVDKRCPAQIYSESNISQALEYVEQQIDILRDVKSYSDQEDPEYYEEWYGGVVRGLSEDPTGIVSFVLWEYHGCNGPDKECEIARHLNICIADENFAIDGEHCFDNLAARRQKFLDNMSRKSP